MASGPFLCYRELLPPTGVLCSTFFKCVGDDYLMTTTSGTVNVYHIHQDWKKRDKANGILSHRLSVNVNGSPRDLCTLSSPVIGMKSAQNDEVVITFDKGKVVVVVYDVHFNSLKVINMVNAEDGAIGDAAFVASETSSSRLIHPGVGETPFISVTEDSSLSCINLNAYKLFFVPHRDQKLCASTAWAQKGFLLDLSSLYLPGAVLDKCFLSGYSRPTLAVLQDNGALPIGHSASVLHTCSLTVLAVDVATRNCVVLWRQENLPHDSLLLQPLPSSVARGGALLITNNALLIVTQESVHGLATNGFAKTTVAEKIPLVPWPLKGGVTMHACRFQALSATTLPHRPQPIAYQSEDCSASFAASLADGTLVVLRMEAVGGESISGGNIQYEVEVIANSVQSTCLSVLPAGPGMADSDRDDTEAWRYLWFVGSGTADCLLLDVTVTCFVSGATTRLFSHMMSLGTGMNGGTGEGGSANSGVAGFTSPAGLLPSAKKQRRMSKTPLLTTGGSTLDGEVGGGLFALTAEMAAKVAEEETLFYSTARGPQLLFADDSLGTDDSDTGLFRPVRLDDSVNQMQSEATALPTAASQAAENAAAITANTSPSLSEAEVKQMKVHELKSALEDRGASSAGLKAALCARLLDVLAEETETVHAKVADADGNIGDTAAALDRGSSDLQKETTVSVDDTALSMMERAIAVTGAVPDPQPILSEWRRRSVRCRVAVVDRLEVMGPILSGSLLQSDEAICSSADVMWDREEGAQKGASVSTQLANVSSAKYASIPPSVASYIVERERKDALQLCTGLGSEGCLSRVSRGLRLAKIASRNFSDISGVCSLFCANRCTLLFLSREGPGVGAPGRNSFGSAIGGTRVICSGERFDISKGGVPEVFFEELDPLLNCFVIDQPTIAVGTLTPSGDVCLQACLKGLRVIRLVMEDGDGNRSEKHVHPVALQDCLVEEELDIGGMGGSPNETVVSVDCCGEGGGWVVVLTSTGTMYILQYDNEDESLGLKYKWTSSACADSLSDGPSAGNSMVPSTHPDRVISVSLFNGRLPLESASEELLAAVAESELQAAPSATANPAVKLPTRLQRSGSFEEKAGEWGEVREEGTSAFAEEEFLYGAAISADDVDTAAFGAEKTSCNGHASPMAEAGDAMEECASGSSSKQTVISDEDETYVLLVNRAGRVSFIQLTDSTGMTGGTGCAGAAPVKVFETPPLGALPVYLTVGSRESYANQAIPDDAPLPKRYVVDARLAYLGRHHDGHDDLLSLCLVAVMNTGDVVVYNAIQSPSVLLAQFVADSCSAPQGGRVASSYHRSATIRVFRKVEHSECTRKRKNARLASERLRRAARGGGTSTHRERETCQSLLIATPRHDRNDRGVCVLVSGAHPLVVSCVKGLPCIQPLGLPEVPYAGMGAHLSTYFSAGETKGVAVLWREDKLDAEESIARAGARAVTCLSTLGIYKDVPGLVNYPRSSVSVAKTKVGLTTHKSLALSASKTEDKTQQALLSSPTFLMSCSEVTEVPFTDSVFTDAEVEAEEGAYVRFFPDLTSFCSPVNDLAPAPVMQKEEHKLVVMQGRNRVVDTFKLEEGEKVLDICVLYLTTGAADANAETNSLAVRGKKQVFLAAGTCYDDKHGEDTRGEGRLLFFSLDYAMYQNKSNTKQHEADGGKDEGREFEKQIEAIEEVEGPLPGRSADAERSEAVREVRGNATTTAANAQFFDSITPKLRLVWSGLGPSSVVTQFRDEYVLSTVGSVLYIYKLNQETMELDQIAFIYAQFYIASVSIMKDYIVIADACRSIQFVVWREKDNSLTLLGKDYDQCESLSAGFIIDGDVLGIAVGDTEGNVQLMRYNPRVVESKKGFKLLRLSDFHMGSNPNMMLPHRLLEYPSGMPTRSSRVRSESLSGVITQNSSSAIALAAATVPLGSRFDKTSSGKSALLVGTVEGGLGLLLPIEERTHRRLALLQNIMSTSVPMACALNPAEYRSLKTSRARVDKKRGVLDGNLLWNFVNLPGVLQDELAAAMGTSADVILENLQDLDMLTSFF